VLIGSCSSQGMRHCPLLRCEESTTIHPIYRVQNFQIAAPYNLRVQFNDGSKQSINFGPVLAGQLYGRYVTCRYSTEFNSTWRSIRWCGPTGLTLIQQHFTIGLNKSMNYRACPSVGTHTRVGQQQRPNKALDRIAPIVAPRGASPLGFKANESRNSDRSVARIEHKANPL
jgi:hypothetical protein